MALRRPAAADRARFKDALQQIRLTRSKPNIRVERNAQAYRGLLWQAKSLDVWQGLNFGEFV